MHLFLDCVSFFILHRGKASSITLYLFTALHAALLPLVPFGFTACPRVSSQSLDVLFSSIPAAVD